MHWVPVPLVLGTHSARVTSLNASKAWKHRYESRTSSPAPVDQMYDYIGSLFQTILTSLPSFKYNGIILGSEDHSRTGNGISKLETTTLRPCLPQACMNLDNWGKP